MARTWMAGLVSFKVGALRPVLLTAAAVAALGLPACGASSTGGSGGATAGKAGDPCNPNTQNQGCLQGLRMQCQTDATSGLGGKWQLAGPCAVGEICVETVDPTGATKRIATCKSSATGGDATSGGDGTTSSDATGSGGDGSVGSDDTGTSPKDTGPVIGSCGDGFCNTGETAASCPEDCGAAPVCNNNGVCEAGETKANCPADCTTVSPKCNNDGVCGTGETTANCPNDCPATTDNCGNLVCDAGEDATSCPIDCDPANLCVNQNCPTEWSACLNDAGCVAFLNCLNPCAANDNACVQACITKAGNATVTMFTDVQTCYKNAGCGGSTTGGNPCDTACGSQASIGCYCDAVCMQNGDCCGDAQGTAASTCAGSTCADCGGGGTSTGPVCGNGKCETGETTATCAADCPSSGGTCTTYADVQQILVSNCNGCHGHKFGNNCAATSGHDIAGWVANGSMPTNKTLSAADKAKIASWAATGNACTLTQCP